MGCGGYGECRGCEGCADVGGVVDNAGDVAGDVE